jgi:hypothetical protein
MDVNRTQSGKSGKVEKVEEVSLKCNQLVDVFEFVTRAEVAGRTRLGRLQE